MPNTQQPLMNTPHDEFEQAWQERQAWIKSWDEWANAQRQAQTDWQPIPQYERPEQSAENNISPSGEAGSIDSQNIGRDFAPTNQGGNTGSNGSPMFTDAQLALIEKYTNSRLGRFGAGMVVPGAGIAGYAANWLAGRALDNRAAGNWSDANNQQWGGGQPVANEDSSGYFQGLMGQNPFAPVNPDTGAPLGETGGMPGARDNVGDIDRMYGANEPRAGMPAFGSGGPWYTDGRGGFQFSPSGHPDISDGGDQVFNPFWIHDG